MHEGGTMKTKIAIYLAGSIKKGHEKSNESYWTPEDLESLKNYLSDYEVSFLNPAFRSDDLYDQRSVFGRDMTQVYCSNVVFVDARDRRGLGVGAEMMWAKFNKIPVVSWAPKDTHYHKSKTTVLDVPVDNFIHPFVVGLSDYVAESLADGANWIQTIMSSPSTKIRDIQDIASDMEYYKKNQLHKDAPMRDFLNFSQEHKARLENAHPHFVESSSI